MLNRYVRKTRNGIETLPDVGTRCEVAGANSDSGREWVYTKCVVLGYSPDGLFGWFQVPGCWPFQEKLENCLFKSSKGSDHG